MGFFHPPELVDAARGNVGRHAWAQAARDRMVDAARPWLAMSEDELWDLMFGATITRSWMVWSNGACPACRQGVPMYQWTVKPLELPWKVRCPHCAAPFPTNDFGAFYRSGLDEGGVFDPGRADRSLLFNAAHPAPDDPLRGFGVDDGEGYVDGQRRWRFVGAYIVYGQWKQLVLGGIKALSEAGLITGEAGYAHRAGILLHRVADLYPTHDFELQGLAYEKGHGSGYVSTWHDACAEARALALAYDAVREDIARDGALAAFLGTQARRYRGVGPCGTPREVCRHIEGGILRDTLANTKKITSNFPQTDITRLVILGVLGDGDSPESRSIADAMIEKATSVDGVTGEKGMTAYTAGAVGGMAEYLALGERSRPGFLASMLARHPRLVDMFRFHIDTWCIGHYYPNSGDSGWFAERRDRYVGVDCSREIDSGPSMFSFLWQLAECTGDHSFVQALYRANERQTKGLPYDLFASDPEAMERSVRATIDRHGAELCQGSVRKDAWRIAILRSGTGEQARAAWVTSRVGGNHKHFDGMHLGLYARGLDLLPDFGYPPVNYGGWGSPQALWYRTAASHNTVVVDGEEQREATAQTTLWAAGRTLQLMRFSSPEMAGVARYERTVVLVDVSDEGFYLVDLFRVSGGREHCYTLHAGFGAAETAGVAPASVDRADLPPWLRALPLRELRRASSPAPGWSVDWRIHDRFGYLPAGTEAHLRCTSLTSSCEAWTGQAWISVSGYRNEEAWIPRMMQRRLASSDGPPDSCFVNVLEPYGAAPAVRTARRLSLASRVGAPAGDSSVALEIELADEQRDLLLFPDVGGEVVEPSTGLCTDAQVCFVRSRAGAPRSYALAGGSLVDTAGLTVRTAGPVVFAEGETRS